MDNFSKTIRKETTGYARCFGRLSASLRFPLPIWAWQPPPQLHTRSSTYECACSSMRYPVISHYQLGSLSWTSRTFYFPDSRDLLEALGGLPWQRERERPQGGSVSPPLSDFPPLPLITLPKIHRPAAKYNRNSRFSQMFIFISNFLCGFEQLLREKNRTSREDCNFSSFLEVQRCENLGNLKKLKKTQKHRKELWSSTKKLE